MTCWCIKAAQPAHRIPQPSSTSHSSALSATVNMRFSILVAALFAVVVSAATIPRDHHGDHDGDHDHHDGDHDHHDGGHDHHDHHDLPGRSSHFIYEAFADPLTQIAPVAAWTITTTPTARMETLVAFALATVYVHSPSSGLQTSR